MYDIHVVIASVRVRRGQGTSWERGCDEKGSRWLSDPVGQTMQTRVKKIVKNMQQL